MRPLNPKISPCGIRRGVFFICLSGERAFCFRRTFFEHQDEVRCCGRRGLSRIGGCGIVVSSDEGWDPERTGNSRQRERKV